MITAFRASSYLQDHRKIHTGKTHPSIHTIKVSILSPKFLQARKTTNVQRVGNFFASAAT